ncbi:uncharacterized protein LOC111258165 isoform X2 [Setaria italica]|uniref:uncharacterized protein LOC111258165 isoform X2 n=1 Tax=Setaria italica TaxID=4555 RepID=UPI000BE4E34C|nr:uncharacterized protein LOC111258165 isoform X2 [Setaria italica]
MCAWRRRMRGEARGEELAAHAAMRWRHEVAAWQCEVTAWRHGTAPTATLSATFSLFKDVWMQQQVAADWFVCYCNPFSTWTGRGVLQLPHPIQTAHLPRR